MTKIRERKEIKEITETRVVKERREMTEMMMIIDGSVLGSSKGKDYLNTGVSVLWCGLP